MAEPVFLLAAAPKANAHVPTLTRAEGVRQLLENPPYTRYAGWNLLTLERAELMVGPRLHVQNGHRKFLDLYADGTLTALGVFDGFLGWGRWEFARRPKVNGLAVVEFTREFVAFYDHLLESHIEPLPDAVRFAVGVRNAHYEHEGEPRRLYLSPGPVGDLYDLDQYDRCEAPSSDLDTAVTDPIDAETSPDEPHLEVDAIAFQLLRRFYNWFGLNDEDVPYTNDRRDAIDFDLIRAMN